MINSTGQAYTFGIIRKSIPTLIQGSNNVIQISTGNKYTAFVDSNNQVYTFGIGSQGQLGHGDFKSILRPSLIQGFDNIVQVSCGDRHTSFIKIL